jgi:hypothetical protein
MKLLFAGVGLFTLLCQAQPAREIRVECEEGQTIAQALRGARSGDTIKILGTCSEKVTVAVDGVRLDGGGSAVLEEPFNPPLNPPEFNGLLTIDGARGVVISGLVIQRSRAEGILAVRGASALVLGSTVQDNAGTGIAVNSSRVELVDSTVRRNLFGLDAFGHSSILLKGRFTANGNRIHGIGLIGSSNLEVRGARVEASENGEFGVSVFSQSSFDFLSFQTSTGSSMTLARNGAGGMVVGASIFSVTSANTRVSIVGSPVGIWMPAQSTLAIGPESTLLVERNTVGLNLGGGVVMFALGTLTVRSSAETGILADSAQVNLFSPLSEITGNGVDMDLRFGAQATVAGATVGTRRCESSVMVRGSISCP